MPGLAHHLAAMAYNNAWANHRLLQACSRLSPEAFVATRTSFFPSIAATLNHNLPVDWFYVDALERSFSGQEPNPEAQAFYDPEVPFPVCADLTVAQRAVDRRLIALSTALTDERLELPVAVPWRAGLQHELAARLLGHLFQHQVHHRGQAHAMLAGTSVAPPQLDEFFCAADARLRAKDFEELGWSEAMIWGGSEDHP
jgi:uncharacterized damage-inducible protein DinB